MPINKVTITQPATGSTLTIADGKTLTCTQNTSLDEAVTMSSKAPKASPTFTGKVTSPQYIGTPTASLSDDTAISFTPGSARGMLFFMAGDALVHHALVAYVIAGAATCTGMVFGSGTVVTTGVLNGTTGTDTKVTISAHTDGKIYIENRAGGTINFHYMLIAGNS